MNILSFRKSLPGEKARDQFRISHIHLTAICFDEVRFTHGIDLKITVRDIEEKRLTSGSRRKNNPWDFGGRHIDGLHNEDGARQIDRNCQTWQSTPRAVIAVPL